MGTKYENIYALYPNNRGGVPMVGRFLQLSPQQRLDAYVWSYKNFMKIDSGPYLCNVLIAYIMGDFRYTGMNFPNENIMHLFPELAEQKPEGISINRPWYHNDEDGNIARLEILRNAVIKVKEEIDILS